jgi:hypothetical protein
MRFCDANIEFSIGDYGDAQIDKIKSEWLARQLLMSEM